MISNDELFEPSVHLRRSLYEFLKNPQKKKKPAPAVFSGYIPSLMHFGLLNKAGDYIYTSPGTVQFGIQTYFKTKNPALEKARSNQLTVPKNVEWLRLSHPDTYKVVKTQIDRALDTDVQQTALIGTSPEHFISMVLPMQRKLIEALPVFLNVDLDSAVYEQILSHNIVVWMILKAHENFTQYHLAAHIERDPLTTHQVFVDSNEDN